MTPISILSDITEIISISIPAITIAIFLLMFSEFSTVKMSRLARQSSIFAGLSFLIVSIAQIFGNFFLILASQVEDPSGYDVFIQSCGTLALLSFAFGLLNLFRLVIELIKPIFEQ